MSNVVFGRTHNPFNGESEIWVQPTEGALPEKVRETLKELAEKGECVEIESDGSSMKTRPLRRTCQAAVKIAAELLTRGKITDAQAVASIPLKQFGKMLTAQIADISKLELLGSGLAAAPGAASGKLVTSAVEALALTADGTKVILLVEKTTPDDMAALKVVSAIVATSGGFTSHSAVVARQMGKPCIVSYTGNMLSEDKNAMVTIDGSSGKLYKGEATFKETAIDSNVRVFLEAADRVAKLQVYANADTAEDVQKAIDFGARGIGLCRTEHTFFSEEGIIAIRRLILAKGETAKQGALSKLQNVQFEHFRKLFAALGARPAVVRLLDPPMHEFLPQLDDKEGITNVSKALKLKVGDVKQRIQELKEENPMLGHRGCRLSITFPKLAEIQTYAIIAAARSVAKYTAKGPTSVGIMIPLIVDVREMKELISEVKDGIKRATDEYALYAASAKQEYQIGAMLETPRACLQAYQLAEYCDFFSFGTNDLTQTTWALSRDDGAKFMSEYVSRGLVNEDPFTSLDVDGVGALMAHAIETLNDRRKKVKVGICGEHGGDPKSIEFCNSIALDYVSCSPFRILLARAAAAHAALIDVEVPAFAAQEITIEPPIMMVVETKKEKQPVKAADAANVKDWIEVPTDVSGKDFFYKFDDWFAAIASNVGPNGQPTTSVKSENDLMIGKIVGFLKGTNKVLLSFEESGWIDYPAFPNDFEFGKSTAASLTKVWKWVVPVNQLKFIKPTNVTPEKVKEDPVPAAPLPAISLGTAADTSFVGWTKFNKDKLPQSLFSWSVFIHDVTKDQDVFGVVVGESKAFNQQLIVAVDDLDAKQIPFSSILYLAPPGTAKDTLGIPSVGAEPINAAPTVVSGGLSENVDASVGTAVILEAVTPEPEYMNLQEIENLPHADIAKKIAGAYAYLNGGKPTWSKVIGWMPNPNGQLAFTVELPPSDHSGHDGMKLKSFIKYLVPIENMDAMKDKQLNTLFSGFQKITKTKPPEWK